MLIHNRYCVSQNLSSGRTVAIARSVAVLRGIVLAGLQLLLVELQLRQQAFTKIAATDSRRIQLAYDFKRFVELFHRKVWLVNFWLGWRGSFSSPRSWSWS